MELKLTFEDGSEGLAHYGRKGMKWHQHIFQKMGDTAESASYTPDLLKGVTSAYKFARWDLNAVKNGKNALAKALLIRGTVDRARGYIRNYDERVKAANKSKSASAQRSIRFGHRDQQWHPIRPNENARGSRGGKF